MFYILGLKDLNLLLAGGSKKFYCETGLNFYYFTGYINCKNKSFYIEK